jgi:hypothetical protein
MANRNFSNGGKLYIMETKPVMVTMNFIVDPTNENGINSLKGATVKNVFMNANTPGALNPDPVNGTIVIRLQDNYNRLLGITHSIVSPNSGSALKIDNAVLTPGTAYVISTLGDATAATWHALGVPDGVTPAVGVAFIAKTNGGSANVSTSRVMATASTGSSVASLEIVGDSNLSIAPDGTKGQGFGAQIILQARDYAGALVAPAAGSLISITLFLSDSSLIVQGQ